jgi:hypothetical protein
VIMKPEKKNEVVNVERTELTVPTDMLAIMAQTKDSGFDGIDAADVAIPFIGILQSLSPQVKKGHPSQIPGAEEGMLYNNVTLEVYKPPVKIIPCAFKKAWVEWKPRETGGGFVQQHADDSLVKTCKRDEKNNEVLPNGNHLAPTAYHFVLVVRNDGKFDRAIISMTKTQLKKSRRWLSQMISIQLKNSKGELFRPPMYSHTYDVNTVLETRDQFSWQGFLIENPQVITDMNLYKEATKFFVDVTSGNIKATMPIDEHLESVPTDSNVM